jgi:hypothetical protein
VHKPATTPRIEARTPDRTSEVGSDGAAPVPQNFANWIPTAEGMEILFSSYHFDTRGRFSPAITVPWSVLTGALAPNMAAVAQS